MLFLSILTTSILPMFAIILTGILLDRKFHLDLHTLGKLNFYILLPCFIFRSLYLADFQPSSVSIVLCGALILFGNSISATIYAHFAGYSASKREALRNTSMFNNCGNIGTAIITLIFSHPPYVIHGQTPYLHTALVTVIALLIIQNISCNTLGFYQAGRGLITTRDALSLIFHMPTIYVVPTALLLKLAPFHLQEMFLWPTLNFVAQAFVAMALMTLGVQIARTPFNIFKRDILGATALRLIGGPLVAIPVISFVSHLYAPLNAVEAQTVLIVYGVPTAINVALIAAEMRSHPDYATQVVMATTLLSTFTLPFVILLAMYLYPL